MSAAARPIIRHQNIPDELKRLNRWVNFVLEGSGTRPTKVPYTPGTRSKAKSNDPATWRSFAAALAATERHECYLGFAFTPDLGMTFLDLDHVVGAGGIVRAWARQIIDELDSYTEVSLNNGIHIFVRGTPPARFRTDQLKGKIEIYPQHGGRFCLVTGDTRPSLGSLDGLIEARGDVLTRLFPARTEPVTPLTSRISTNGATKLPDDAVETIVTALQPHWSLGKRHDLGVAMGGILAKNSVPEEQALALVARLSGGDARPDDRAKAVRDSYRKWRDGHDLRGYQALRDLVPADALAIVDETLDHFSSAHGFHRKRASGSDDTPPTVLTADDPHLTDLGNAKRLIARHGHALRYCDVRGAWYIWDGTRWARDDSGEIERRAKETILSLYAEAAAIPTKKERVQLLAHAMKSESAVRLRAMIALAESEPGVPVSVDALDADPWLLNCRNGTIDLRTGELRPHDPADLLTRLVPVEFDPLAECPRWLAFLDRVLAGRRELVAFVQRAVGYSLTGVTVERCLFILHGRGKNGKSKTLETIMTMLADYAARSATDLLLSSRDQGIPNDVARLKGIRFVFASESDEGRKLAEAKVKDLTGGDTISARFMRQEWFDFKPEFKLWLGTNHRPNIRGTDDAIWDRIRLIPFNVRIPDEEQDKDLLAKLLAEAPGILAWAVEGCLAWRRDGLGEPSDVREATRSYRSEEDVIGRFIAERCDVSPSASVTKDALYVAFKSWMTDSGEREMSKKMFGTRLAEGAYGLDLDEARVGSGRERARTWLGIGLIPEYQSNG